MRTFLRSQLVAAAATLTDFLSYSLLSQVAGLALGPAATLGALGGGCVGFYLGRIWAFQAAEASAVGQGFRYTLVCLASALLNGALVHLLAEFASAHFAVARVLAALAVGLSFNYPLHKHYVFRKQAKPDS